MTWFLAGALSVAAALASRPPAPDQAPHARSYPSVAAAVEAALASGPVLVGFGEYHQTRATAGIPSALHRFTTEILPVLTTLRPRLSHLVLETWVANGRCGEAERVVTADIEKTTERPAATEGELEALIRTAAATGVKPRILSVSCADYEAMRASANSVDYDRTLRVTGRALETAALSALAERQQVKTVDSGRAALAIYGGALHNDVHGHPDLMAYSFAPRLTAATLGRYVEIDLLVPEYAARNPSLRAQPWWSAYLRLKARERPGNSRVSGASRASRQSPAGRPVGTVMVGLSPRSFVIIFPEARSRR